MRTQAIVKFSKNDDPKAGTGEQSLDFNGLHVSALALAANNKVDAIVASVVNFIINI